MPAGMRPRARYKPMISVTLATNSGSVENLKVSARHGVTPNDRHAFNTVTWSSFSRFASSRDNQWVPPTEPVAAATPQR